MSKMSKNKTKYQVNSVFY